MLICFSTSAHILLFLQNSHQPKQLTNRQIKTISSLTNLDDLRNHMKHIAVERVVGTPSHAEVRKYISSTLKALGWFVEEHDFEQNTPIGAKRFVNIVAKLSNQASRYLVLAAHYDSLMMPGFIGATDSAVPCAMLLNLAQVMHPFLNQHKYSKDVSLKLVFFDGEEAFEHWSDTDSIYGAKELARHLDNYNPELDITELDQWDLLVLLDLLGTPQPKFYNYIPSGSTWYLELVSAERKLVEQKLLTGSFKDGYFKPQSRNHYVEDDHLPFMRRGR